MIPSEPGWRSTGTSGGSTGRRSRRRFAGPVLGGLAVVGLCLPELLVLIGLAGTLAVGLFVGGAGALVLAALVLMVARHVRAAPSTTRSRVGQSDDRGPAVLEATGD